MKIRIGIDIGGKGAIAFFVDGKLTSYYAFPRTEERPDIRAFVNLILSVVNSDDDVHVAMEDLHSIYGAGAHSNFQFGWINGVTEAVCTTLGLPYTKIGPKKWQKEMWQGIRPVEVKFKSKLNENPEPLLPQPQPQPSVASGDFNMDSFLNGDSGLANAIPANPVKKQKVKVDTKATSLLAAKRLFPNETFLATARSKVPHDGIVDAVLIGEYCKRHF